MSKITYGCGFVAIVGRPNVGKSTLLNRLVGKKISITSRRAQTTRHRIMGILNENNNQMAFVDTPGLHQQSGKRGLNRRMNKLALSSIQGVDVVVWILEADRWQEQDQWIASLLQKCSSPIIIAINKVDRLADKRRLLPQTQFLADKSLAQAVVPISAKQGQQLAELKQEIAVLLPVASQLPFPETMLTDRGPEFIIAEIIREKLTRYLHEELPYALSVSVETLRRHEKFWQIEAVIWVAKESQKAIVIGNQGERLKQISILARQDMQGYLDNKVHLRCWVKIKSDWMHDDKILDLWGYG